MGSLAGNVSIKAASSRSSRCWACAADRVCGCGLFARGIGDLSQAFWQPFLATVFSSIFARHFAQHVGSTWL
jgi:hypothetical protein